MIFHRSATGSKIFTRGNKKWRGSPARASPLLYFAGQHQQLRPSRELWREITRETTRRKLLITRYWTDVSCFRLSIELPDSFRERRAANSTSYLYGDNVIFTVAVNYFQKKKRDSFSKKKKGRKKERMANLTTLSRNFVEKLSRRNVSNRFTNFKKFPAKERFETFPWNFTVFFFFHPKIQIIPRSILEKNPTFHYPFLVPKIPSSSSLQIGLIFANRTYTSSRYDTLSPREEKEISLRSVSGRRKEGRSFE